MVVRAVRVYRQNSETYIAKIDLLLVDEKLDDRVMIVIFEALRWRVVLAERLRQKPARTRAGCHPCPADGSYAHTP